MQASTRITILCGLLSIVVSARPFNAVCETPGQNSLIQMSGASGGIVPNQTTSSNPESAPRPPATANDKAAESVGTYRPGAGTVVLAELTRSLDAGKLRVGENVECTVIQDLLYQGKVIIPHGAKVKGHVTEAKAHTKDQPESRLGIAFDGIVLKDKKELPFQFPAFIEAVASPIKMGSTPTTRVNDMPIFMPKGSTTGGAAIDAVSANASLAGANMPSTSGAIDATNRGVIGLKGLALDPTASVITSRKSNVQLPYAAQLLLRVSSPKQHD